MVPRSIIDMSMHIGRQFIRNKIVDLHKHINVSSMLGSPGGMWEKIGEGLPLEIV